jgi:putative transposase
MSEAFVKILRRDYARVTPLPDARTVLGPVEGWITDCNASSQRTSRGLFR